MYFEKDKFDTLYSIPIFNISKVLFIEETTREPDEEISMQVNMLVETGQFDEKEQFILGGDSYA